tara:strand:+ start:1217 stop:1699 length:483 start_codon:yes stop_codon:yes gene_type:complete
MKTSTLLGKGLLLALVSGLPFSAIAGHEWSTPYPEHYIEAVQQWRGLILDDTSIARPSQNIETSERIVDMLANCLVDNGRVKRGLEIFKAEMRYQYQRELTFIERRSAAQMRKSPVVPYTLFHVRYYVMADRLSSSDVLSQPYDWRRYYRRGKFIRDPKN